MAEGTDFSAPASCFFMVFNLAKKRSSAGGCLPSKTSYMVFSRVAAWILRSLISLVSSPSAKLASSIYISEKLSSLPLPSRASFKAENRLLVVSPEAFSEISGFSAMKDRSTE
ncbi:hypothetical protein D9M68_651720 [compost metagenome]